MISKISFLGEETNLLQLRMSGLPHTTSTKDIPKINEAPKIVNVSDTYENRSKITRAHIKEYAGVGALVISVLGIPLTYKITQKSVSKNAQKILKAEREKLIAELKQKTPEDLVSKKDRLVNLLLGLFKSVSKTMFFSIKQELRLSPTLLTRTSNSIFSFSLSVMPLSNLESCMMSSTNLDSLLASS